MKTVVNKFDHKHHMPYPTHHTVGFFDTEEALYEVLEALKTHGVRPNKIDVFQGEEGLRSIDVQGDEHWFLGKILRLSQRFFDTGEWSLFQIADEELKQGHTLLTVTTETEETKNEVANIMAKHHGHDIKYFNPMYVEHFSKEIGDVTKD